MGRHYCPVPTGCGYVKIAHGICRGGSSHPPPPGNQGSAADLAPHLRFTDNG